MASASDETTAKSTKVRRPKYNTNCSVFGCHSKKGNDRSLHFHVFPDRDSGITVKMINNFGFEEIIDKRKAWEHKLQMGKPVTKAMRVCSKHFTDEDYCAKGVMLKQPKLRRCAIPSRNLPDMSFSSTVSTGSTSNLRAEKLPLKHSTICEDTTSIKSEELTNKLNIEELTLPEQESVQGLLAMANNPHINYHTDQAVKVSRGDLIVQFSSTIKHSTSLNSLTGYLSTVLQALVYWPSLEEVQQNMPSCFNSFNNIRVILDCLEIPIQKPKCLCCRLKLYSHYKGKHTIKIMTGVSPAGIITFISKSYDGRSSDQAIFEQSNLIKKLQPQKDGIMVVKGFLIDQTCIKYDINLVRLHFLGNEKQFSESEAKENVSSSKASVHVERVNQRMRIFKFLNTPLHYNFIPLIDNIMIIIGAMVNLQSAVLAENKLDLI